MALALLDIAAGGTAVATPLLEITTDGIKLTIQLLSMDRASKNRLRGLDGRPL
jgi:hypothetical protein